MSTASAESVPEDGADADFAVRTLGLAMSALELARAATATFSELSIVPQSELKLLIGLLQHTIAGTSVFPDLPPQYRQTGIDTSVELGATLTHLSSLSD